MQNHQSGPGVHPGFLIRILFALCLLTALSAPAHAEKVNLNAADADTLTYIPGIGPSKARAIIDIREEMGGFTTVEDLLTVPGIGEKSLETIREYGTIDGGVDTLTEEMRRNPPKRVSATTSADASSG